MKFDMEFTRQPRSQGLSSYRLGRARRDPGLVWSRATVTIENIREGSSVIRPFVALSFVALSRHRHHTRYLKEVFELKFRTVSIPTFISRLGKSFLRQLTVVVMLLSSYPLDLWTVMNCGRRDRADPVQSNFIISELIVINRCFSFKCARSG